MARTPTRLAGPMLVDSTPETVYTTPGATVTVVKNIIVNNPSGGALTFTLSIGADATATRMINVYSIPAGGMANFHVYIPLAATNTLQASSSGDDVLVMTIGGDQIT